MISQYFIALPTPFRNGLISRARVREAIDGTHAAVIHVYDAAGNVIEANEHVGGFRRRRICSFPSRPAPVPW